MKRFKLIYICCALALVLSGCEKFLDIKPKGRDVPHLYKHYDGMFNTTGMINLSFTQLTETGSMMLLESNVYYPYLSDEFTCSSTSFKNLNRKGKSAYSWQPDILVEEDYSAEWGALYAQIYTLNAIVDGIKSVTDATEGQKRALEAEARVRRAYNYMMLAQFYAKPYNQSTAKDDPAVPLVTKADVSVNLFDRTSVKDLYDFMVKEMEENVPLLPEKFDYNLRLSRAAGYAILGKLHMYMENYPKALQSLKLSMQGVKSSPSDKVGLYDYNVTMAQWGYNSAMPWAFAATGSVPYPNRTNHKESMYALMASVSGITFFFYEPTLFIKDSYIAKFGATDMRRCFYSNKSYTGVTTWPHYRQIQNNAMTVAVGVADIYLMLAECEARVGSASEARQVLQEFRKHRMPLADSPVPASVVTNNDLIKFTVEERLREYMGLGYRWFDIRRLWNDPLFQDLKKDYTHIDGSGNTFTLSEKRLVMQIPPKVMLYNPNWKDND